MARAGKTQHVEAMLEAKYWRVCIFVYLFHAHLVFSFPTFLDHYAKKF